MTTSATDEAIAELQVLTEEQVSAITGLGRNTLKAKRRTGTGPRVTVLSTGRIGYRVRDVREWLDERAETQEADVDQQTRAALADLDAVKVRNAGGDLIAAVRNADTPMHIRLLEAIELLAYLVRLSDRPEDMLAALRERVNAASTD
jgi:predicted DNA-binding transcriptional regulator AlpA